MDQKQLERYGNELTIIGLVVGNGKEKEIIVFPGDGPLHDCKVLETDQEEVLKIFDQLDTLAITGLENVVLRKSQRNIEQGISWEVFRRDNFTCRYCGADDVPMTVDHIVRWENLGASVPDNLICSCRKCNKTRGNTEYPDWLTSQYYLDRVSKLPAEFHERNVKAWAAALAIPLRPRQRAR
jgi:hypothetical protein